MWWGRLSDSYGRKPIVICGLVGTVCATLVFGFSKSYTQALLARSMAGLLNGNVGVIRTMVGEMDIAKSDQAKAFSVMPFVSNIGSIVGPVLGGLYFSLETSLNVSLADPVEQYPGLFGKSAFFSKYPYALPNLVTATMLALSAIFGFLFLSETHGSVKGKKDLGIKFRQWLHRVFFQCSCHHGYRRLEGRTTTESILLSPTGIGSQGSNQRRQSTKNSASTAPRLPFQAIFTKQVLINMVIWACLAVQNNTYGQLFPIFCSSNISDGGLGMRPGQIGLALSVAAIMAIVFQMTLFPYCYNRWGGVSCLRVCLGLYPPLYFVYPSTLHKLI
jgi:MFS family permease